MKTTTTIAGLIISCAVLLINTFAEGYDLREKDYRIMKLEKDNKLKDSLYLQCNGELSKSANDPIYLFYQQNDLNASDENN